MNHDRAAMLCPERDVIMSWTSPEITFRVRLRADRQFDFEKPASIRSRADELRLHRLDEITQPRGSGWRDFTGSVTLGFSEQEVRAFYTV